MAVVTMQAWVYYIVAFVTRQGIQNSGLAYEPWENVETILSFFSVVSHSITRHFTYD